MLVKPLVRSIVRSIAGVPTNSLGSGFSPVSLFADGSKGVVYDNNDLSSFYLDSAGTTAATVNGLVGLQLDKSLANITARRNLASYTEAFANAYWNKVTVSLASATAPDGASTATTMTATAGPGDRIERNGIIAGATGTHTYSLYIKRGNTDLVQISLRNSTTATDLAVSLFDVNAGTVSSVITGTSAIESIGGGWYRCSVTSSGGVTAGNSLRLYAYCGTSSATIGHTATIWGAQLEAGTTPSAYQKVVQEEGGWMLGNHRYQTTTGSKPVLRGTPTGANLVTNGDFASGTAGWNGTNATLSNVSNRLRATVVAGGAVSRATWTLSTTASKTYRITAQYATDSVTSNTSIYVGTVDGVADLLNIFCGSTTGTYVGYFTATGSTTYIALSTTATLALAGEFNEWDNVEVVDVSAGSVTAPYGLQYDGVDDFLQTAAVDFTATDKMFVCAGVRKLSDAATAMLVEHSTIATSNNGTFYITAPESGGASKFAGISRGTLGTSFGTTSTTYNAPYLGVVSLQGDIAGDSMIVRINGTQVASSVLDQGTGNYGNHAIYFGRRAGTSLPYNGLDFGFVIVGKTLTSNQISSTERYIAQRTGISL